MWKLIGLSIIQSLMLSLVQLTLKFAMERMPAFSWTSSFWNSLLTNWWFMACGILFAIASILWMYILKYLPLNIAYPMVSLSYVFAMILAVAFLNETVSVRRWLGVALIVVGCMFIVK